MDKPDGLTLVPFDKDEIIDFLAPLPVGRIWGVGNVTRKVLEKAGVVSIGDLQQIELRDLVSVVGEHSSNHLKQLAYGRDDREIGNTVKEQSISKETTFNKDVREYEILERALLELIDNVGEQLRSQGKYAGVIRLKLRWQGFKTITRQRQMKPPCCDAFGLRNAAIALLKKEPLLKPVRLIGIGVSGICDRKIEQLCLFDDESQTREKKERLSRSVDALKSRYGDAAVGRV